MDNIKFHADGKLVAIVPDDFRTKECIVWRENVRNEEEQLTTFSFNFPLSFFFFCFSKDSSKIIETVGFPV